MNNDVNFDFWYAVNNTHILLRPSSSLETFGTTVLNYHLITELLDSANRIRVREGQMKAFRPEIITPSSVLENLLENFGPQAHSYAEWLGQHEKDLMILKYGFAVANEKHHEEIVTGQVDQIAKQVESTVAENKDPLAAVVVGVDEPWEVCLLKLMVEVVQQSSPQNMQELHRKGIRSEADRDQLALREELEEDFIAASSNPSRLNALGNKLKQCDLFEEYEDRFFSLVRRHKGL